MVRGRQRFRGNAYFRYLQLMRPGALGGIALAIAIGLAVGVGGFTFVYARGASYLTNDPRACANCHVMRDHYDAWVKSSHRAVAACTTATRPTIRSAST